MEFELLGCNAISCDLEDTTWPGNHIVGDATPYLYDARKAGCHKSWWDLVIGHPPCTYLANSGVRHLYVDGKKENGPDHVRWKKMLKGAAFFMKILNGANAKRVAVENPIMHGYAKRQGPSYPSFTVQPWMFGDPESKATCFWVRGDLPPLVPEYPTVEDFLARTAFTKIYQTTHNTAPGPDRWKKRSITFPGIAHALAQQWRHLL